MSQTIGSVQSQTIASKLSGEFETKTISFPLVGDPSVNLMLAILQAIEACGTTPNQSVEVLEYLFWRYVNARDAFSKWQSMPSGVGQEQKGYFPGSFPNDFIRTRLSTDELPFMDNAKTNVQSRLRD